MPLLCLYDERMDAVSLVRVSRLQMSARKLARVLATAVASFLPLQALGEEGAGEGVAGVARNWQTGFSEPASSVARQAFGFHDNFLMPVSVAICVFVFLFGGFICWRFAEKRNPKPSRTTHNFKLEVIWTLVPVAILAVLFVPSFNIMRAIEDVSNADLTVKATGHQWYWSYEYPDHDGLTFDSNLLRGEALKDKSKRLLQTDNALVLPVGEKVRVLVTASDVIHSWSVPRFGVKIDAVPGRLNETWFAADKKGVYYGFCTELCGAGHAYMPVEVHVVSKAEFVIWLRKAKKQFATDTDPRQQNAERISKNNRQDDLLAAQTHFEQK